VNFLFDHPEGEQRALLVGTAAGSDLDDAVALGQRSEAQIRASMGTPFTSRSVNAVSNGSG
jgi:hypothetical protein